MINTLNRDRIDVIDKLSKMERDYNAKTKELEHNKPKIPRDIYEKGLGHLEEYKERIEKYKVDNDL